MRKAARRVARPVAIRESLAVLEVVGRVELELEAGGLLGIEGLDQRRLAAAWVCDRERIQGWSSRVTVLGLYWNTMMFG